MPKVQCIRRAEIFCVTFVLDVKIKIGGGVGKYHLE